MRFRPTRLFCLSVFIVIAASSGSAQPGAAGKARALLDELRQTTGVPAVSGAVARHGKVVFSYGIGSIDLEHEVAATGQSVYNIGSVSKAITAIAIMQLVEAGKVSLDDDIRTYVPQFPDKGAKITIRHLLTHTSGIHHYTKNNFPGTPDNENIQPIQSYLDGLRFFADDPLLFPPGKYYLYSSYGVNLLQGVVEKASGMAFEDYLRERIWKPAGMTTANLDYHDRIIPNRALSYRREDKQIFNYYFNDLRYKFASGGMMGSAEDLVRLAVAVNHDTLLKPESRKQMLSSQTDGISRFNPDKAPTEMEFQQAMLWRIRHDKEGRRIAYECGSVKGFNACVVDFVDEDLVAALMSNEDACCGWKPADALAAIFREETK